MKRVDLNPLAVYEAIVRTRSVSLAAQEAGLSKAAMSHALSRLRHETGDPVLVRSGKEWQLSERALSLRSELADLAMAARRVLSAPGAFEPKTADREFRVHTSDHMLSLIGVPLGRAVATEAPRVALRFLPIAVDDAVPLREGRASARGRGPRPPLAAKARGARRRSVEATSVMPLASSCAPRGAR